MSNSVSLLDIARRALSAQQMGLTVTGHNLANVNTPGYSRQRVVMAPGKPARTPYGFVGSGVEIQNIQASRNGFIDSELRKEGQSLGRWAMREQIFGEIEGVFNEPSEIGLSSLLSDFWDSWRELANDPGSTTSRERVKQVGMTLSSKLHHQHNRLTDLQGALNQELEAEVTEVNTILNKIADLNGKIASVGSGNLTVNDYRDRRSLLLEELSVYADIQVSEDAVGSATVSLGGQILVEKTSVYELGLTERVQDEMVVKDLAWERDGTRISVSNGKLKAITEMRDESIMTILDGLDEIAMALVSEVNAIHETGFGANGSTGNSFFDQSTTGAADIALDSMLINDLARIAVSGDGSAGNNEIGLHLASLSDAPLLSDGSVSVGDYFSTMMGTLGVSTQESQFMHENEVLMIEHLQNEQSAVSGVSIDEEMTNLIKYQHAYEAAAKLISTVDEMMQTLVEMV